MLRVALLTNAQKRSGLYHLSIVHFLVNIPTKNYYNPITHIRVTAENVRDLFYESPITTIESHKVETMMGIGFPMRMEITQEWK